MTKFLIKSVLLAAAIVCGYLAWKSGYVVESGAHWEFFGKYVSPADAASMKWPLGAVSLLLFVAVVVGRKSKSGSSQPAAAGRGRR